MRRVCVWLALAVFLTVSLAVNAADTKQIKGSVVFACPKGKAVKVKSGDTQLLLWVNQKCPRRHHLAAQIKALKTGDHITATYFVKDKKHYVTKIVKK